MGFNSAFEGLNSLRLKYIIIQKPLFTFGHLIVTQLGKIFDICADSKLMKERQKGRGMTV